MPKDTEFETDSDGNIITTPIGGWVMANFAEVGIILGLRYVPTPEALDTGERRSTQFVMTPQQCLELGDALTRLAKKVMDQTSSGKSVN
jgi:hypothetical protein